MRSNYGALGKVTTCCTTKFTMLKLHSEFLVVLSCFHFGFSEKVTMPQFTPFLGASLFFSSSSAGASSSACVSRTPQDKKKKNG